MKIRGTVSKIKLRNLKVPEGLKNILICIFVILFSRDKGNFRDRTVINRFIIFLPTKKKGSVLIYGLFLL